MTGDWWLVTDDWWPCKQDMSVGVNESNINTQAGEEKHSLIINSI